MSCFRHYLLLGLAALSLAASAVRGAVTFQEVHVTNVTTTTFTVVWTTSEVSRPGLDVYADSEGTQLLNGGLALEFFPLAEGDAGVVNDPSARAARRSLENLVINRRNVVVRVSGLSPDTTYYVRPRSFDANDADNSAALAPLQPVTTAAFTGFVADGRILRVKFPAFAAEGMVALVQGPEQLYPLSMVVGDSSDGDTALIPLANLIDMTTGTNAVLAGPQTFTIKVIGADAPEGVATQQLVFSGEFSVAPSPVVETDMTTPEPFFTQHPADQAGVAGETATFSAAATGQPAPQYQWQRLPPGSATWLDLLEDATFAGVATSTLTVRNLTLAMSGDQFRSRAFNGVPPDAYSDAATLTVTAAPAAPAFVAHPTSISVLVDDSAVFTVEATGTPTPSFQWQHKPAGASAWAALTDGGSISGATSSTLTVSSVALAMNGNQYRAVAYNGIGEDAVSLPATLQVTAQAIAPIITVQPQPVTVHAGDVASFTVSATGAPAPAYRWQVSHAGTVSWSDLTESATYTGTLTATLQVVAATPGMSGDRFRAIAANGTAPDASSEAAALTVIGPPVITTQPQSVSVTSGGQATFTVGATGAGELLYQWERRAAGSETWMALVDTTNVSGVTTTSLQVNTVVMVLAGDSFRCVVTNQAGSTASAAAVLMVTKASATVSLTGLRHRYDGAEKTVAVTTVPENLDVTITYNDDATPPKVPGRYTVLAQITESDFVGSATAELVIEAGMVVRQAPTLMGGLDGSLQVLSGTSFKVAGWMSGDLIVPGLPMVIGGENPAFGGVQDHDGASTPNGYSIDVSAPAALRHVVRRVDPVTLPVVASPPAPTGTRTVSLTNATQSAGVWSTIRNLSVSGSTGAVVVPPGTYGSFSVNGSSRLVLGVANATEPAVYNLQSLSVNAARGTATVEVVGPVILTVAGSVTLYGDTGNVDHPEWLQLRTSGTAISLNLTATLHADIQAPNAAVTLAGSSSVRGSLVANRLSIGASAELEEVVSQ